MTIPSVMTVAPVTFAQTDGFAPTTTAGPAPGATRAGAAVARVAGAGAGAGLPAAGGDAPDELPDDVSSPAATPEPSSASATTPDTTAHQARLRRLRSTTPRSFASPPVSAPNMTAEVQEM